MGQPEFTVWIDNDGCPARVREVVVKAAARVGFLLKVVANRYMHPPRGVRAEIIVVGSEFDAADDHIAEQVGAGHVVITADVPLAARVVEKGGTALSPHGRIFDSESIREQLAMRNLRQELRSAGEIHGGGKPLSDMDIHKFAAAFDRLVTSLTA